MIGTFITKSENETLEIGRKFADSIKEGNIICLEGDLGTGKTAFTKGIAKGLGVDEYITSPTFNLVNTYNGRVTIHHFDVYRIADPEELYDIGFDEYIYDNAITIIEWAGLIKDILPTTCIWVKISKSQQDLDERVIEIHIDG